MHLGEGAPAGQRFRERVHLIGGRAETAHRFRQHLAVAARSILLQLGLDRPIALEQPVDPLVPEDPLELRAHTAVPVDQRAVAIKGRPALHAPELTPRSAWAACRRASPSRARRATPWPPGSRGGAA